MAFAAGLSSKQSAGGVSQKSNESADTALSQRSNKMLSHSRRMAGGGGAGTSSRIQDIRSTRIQKREKISPDQSNLGRRSSASEPSETDDKETLAKLNFCVLVGDVGSGQY